jgi:hypothetical protein
VNIGPRHLTRIIVESREARRFIIHSLRIDDVEQLCVSCPASLLSNPWGHLYFGQNPTPEKIVTLEVENIGTWVHPQWKNRSRLSRKLWRWLGPPSLDARPMPFHAALVSA